MARGRPANKLTDEIKAWIATIKGKHTEYSASKIREVIKCQLELQLVKKDQRYSEFQEAKKVVEAKLPSLSSISGFVTSLKIQPSPLDKPWSIGSQSVIPSEMLPVVVETQKLNLQSPDNLDDEMKKYLTARFGFVSPPDGMGLTIREAKWVAVLYPLLKQVAKDRGDNIDIYDVTDHEDAMMWWLNMIACSYATFERMNEILEIDFDSSHLDRGFFITQGFWTMSKGDQVRQVSNFTDTQLLWQTYSELAKKEKEGEAK